MINKLGLLRSGLLLTVGCCNSINAAPPNIIVMMADDMGMGDTSAYQDFTGNADDVQVSTPNMERLARLGVRFTDAHTPTSRCTGTRYGLLTGRYPWRGRLKHWVLFGAQGDPLIEPDRPTIASMLRGEGYRTAIVGKWHVGLRFRQSDGKPAAGWEDADLTKPLYTCPLDHGFDFCRITSRSHGTSGPDAGNPDHPKNRGINRRGPGHLHGRQAIGATTPGRQLVKNGPNAYVLTDLGGRHSDSVMQFLTNHISQPESREQPFFLYYPANSNHGPYTPDTDINGTLVAGAARTKSNAKMDARHDFIFENDVALGRVLDWLASETDPRAPDKKLIDNTLVIFTSDNGAEKNSNVATGPFRSHKGSAYEGGHRVPFIVAWAAGNVGDGNSTTSGQSNHSLVALQDLYATFAEIVGAELPDLRSGEKGAEDSRSVLAAFRGNQLNGNFPIFHNDHNEFQQDHAACAFRQGPWKLLFDADLLRHGMAKPIELYNLTDDRWERNNLLQRDGLTATVNRLTKLAELHRNMGGHRCVDFVSDEKVIFDFGKRSLAGLFGTGTEAKTTLGGVTVSVRLVGNSPSKKFRFGNAGLAVNHGEGLVINFSENVLIESAAIVADEGQCGGYYRLGAGSPLEIYCVDADNDAQDQSGVLSDIGVVRSTEALELHTSPHLGVELPGTWQIRSLAFRRLVP